MAVQNIIGQVELIELPELTKLPVQARIDTGARTSAIWVSKIRKDASGLYVTFFGNDIKEANQEVFFKEHSKVIVTSSNGDAEKRYKVKLLVVVGGRHIRAWFTLADRSKQTYPVLIGRNLLRGKFVVDVSLNKGKEIVRSKKVKS